MTVLGAGRGPAQLDAVVLSLDEMQYLVEQLQIEVPVVLNFQARYDTYAVHSAAMAAAAESLIARELIVDEVIHRDLADRLRALNRPHWVVALRWYQGELINRACIAKGDDLEVVVLRGPDSYTVDEAGHDLPGTLMAALGPAEALELSGMNVLTEELGPILGDASDAATTTARLEKAGRPPRDAAVLGSALVEVPSHASIVGVVYGDATRDISDHAVAVINTRHGRFLVISTRSDDGVQWSSLASGTPARLRTALRDLIGQLPLREDFTPTAGIV